MTKLCKECGQTKESELFYKKNSSLSHYCKECTKVKQRHWDKTHPMAFRNNKNKYYHKKRLARYNLTEEKFQLLLFRQLNRCAICGKETPRWHIDHDHSNGNVRGILCFSCNVGLGSFKDNIMSLQRAIAYLKMPYKMVEL